MIRFAIERGIRGMERRLGVTLEYLTEVGRGLPLEADAERESVRRRIGDAGVVELSIAVASAHVFPVLERGMGYAQTCRIDAVSYAA